jgi:hypothetical protein
VIRVKRGDSFSLACSVNVGGVATDITGWQITSQVRTQGDSRLICNLVAVDRNDVAGVFRLVPAAGYSTKNWPVGVLDWDIQYVDQNDFTVSTETVPIQCFADVTK